MRKAKEEIEGRIGEHYEEKVRQMIEEMKGLYSKVEKACDELGDEYSDKVKQMVQKEHKDAQQERCRKKLDQLKDKTLD